VSHVDVAEQALPQLLKPIFQRRAGPALRAVLNDAVLPARRGDDLARLEDVVIQQLAGFGEGPGAGLAGLFDFSCPGVQDRLVEVAQSRDLDAFLAWNLPDVRVVLAADTRQARRMVSLGPAGANCLRQVYPPSG